MPAPLKVMIVAAEAAPLVSMGELGRSVGGLARALKRERIDVRLIIPKYQRLINSHSMKRLVPEMTLITMNRFRETAIYRDELTASEEVPVYLIEKARFFDREYLYGPPENAYEDNADRFGFFNVAALETLRQIGFYPDIIHCHDWHTGLIPAYLKTIPAFSQDPMYAPIKSVFTIHDLRHKGCFPRETFFQTGLPPSIYTPEGVEFYGQFSFLKAGVVFADMLSTVSKQYRYEIETPEFGQGMEGVFQKRTKDFYGVINGVEYKPFDPRIDSFILSNYTKDDLHKKHRCKRDILEFCGMERHIERPLVGMIAPMYEEKGLDLLLKSAHCMMELPIQFIFVNDLPYRNEKFAAQLGEMMAAHRKHVRCFTDYDEALKHKVLAGADMILMPYQSEPCGVTQMYALKYGTIPVVRATGGLDDTITEFSVETGKGTGFKFAAYTTDALCEKLREALVVYDNQPLWELLQTNAMRANYSWEYTAKKYKDLYLMLLNKGKENH